MTYVTPEQIDQQIQLERTQISQGLKRLRDQTLKLEQQNYGKEEEDQDYSGMVE